MKQHRIAYLLLLLLSYPRACPATTASYSYTSILQEQQHQQIFQREKTIIDLLEDTVASSCSRQAMQYHMQGKMDQAITHYTAAILRRKSLVSTATAARKDRDISYHREDLMVDHIGLGSAYTEQHMYTEATEHLQQALKLYHALGGQKTQKLEILLAIYYSLGSIFSKLDQHDQAITYFEKERTCRERQLFPGIQDPLQPFIRSDKQPSLTEHLTLDHLEGLSRVYNQLSDQHVHNHRRALFYLQRQIVVRKLISKFKTHNHIAIDTLETISLASIYNTIGFVHSNIEDHHQAIPWYQKAIDTAIDIPGDKYMLLIAVFHSNLGNNYYNIAAACTPLDKQQQHWYHKALHSFEQSHLIRTSILSDTDIEVINIESNVANAAFFCHQNDKALRMYAAVIDKQKTHVLRQTGQDKSTAYTFLLALYEMYARALRKDHQYAQAIAYILAPIQAPLYPEAFIPQYYPAIFAAECYIESGKPSKAIPHYKYYIEWKQHKDTTDQLGLADGHNLLGALYHKTGQHLQAILQHAQALSILRSKRAVILRCLIATDPQLRKHGVRTIQHSSMQILLARQIAYHATKYDVYAHTHTQDIDDIPLMYLGLQEITHNIARTLCWLADCYTHVASLAKARKYYLEALDSCALTYHGYYRQIYIYQKLAAYHAQDRQYRKAHHYYALSMQKYIQHLAKPAYKLPIHDFPPLEHILHKHRTKFFFAAYDQPTSAMLPMQQLRKLVKRHYHSIAASLSKTDFDNLYYIRQGDEHYSCHKYDLAVKSYSEFRTLYGDQGHPPLPYARVLERLGHAYHKRYTSQQHTHLYHKIHDLYTRSITCRQRLLGPRHETLGWLYAKMAILHDEQEDFCTAIVYHLMSIDILEEQHGQYDTGIIFAYNSIGSAFLAIALSALEKRHTTIAHELLEVSGKYLLRAYSRSQHNDHIPTPQLLKLHFNMGSFYRTSADLITDRLCSDTMEDTLWIDNNGYYKSAYACFSTSYKLCKEIGDTDTPFVQTLRSHMAYTLGKVTNSLTLF